MPQPDHPRTSERLAARRKEIADRIEQRQLERQKRARSGVRLEAIVLRAPDGSRWELTVDNKGKLTTTQTQPPDELT